MTAAISLPVERPRRYGLVRLVPPPERVVVIPARERPIGDALDTAQRIGWPPGEWCE